MSMPSPHPAGTGPHSGAAPGSFRSGRELASRLQSAATLFAAELRPPRREAAGVEAWIDLHHAVRRLLADDVLLFTTDNAIGAAEEEGLRHLRANLGSGADLSRAIPFLTVKHPLEYCLRFPERAEGSGHRGIVVVGGDRHDGVARCVPHASDLRRLLRARVPGLALGGWANPHRDPVWQVDLLEREAETTDFVLTQVVSHHDLGPLERFLEEIERRKVTTPVLFGVFYYRSGNRATLETLRGLLPVPIAGLAREFDEEKLRPMDVCGRTVEALARLGIRRFYVCNLPATGAAARIHELSARVPGGDSASPRP